MLATSTVRWELNTRQALTAYQQDYGLDATGAVDEATVRALGLI